ncbi:MAG: phytase [Gammaproteobacteria bacterium]
MARSFPMLVLLVATASCAQPHRLLAWPATAARPTAIVRPVAALAETEPVATQGDAADDPAIWVNPDDAAQSLVIGTDKRRGLHLYDLTGRELQSLADGRLNNVDLRDDFPLGDRKVVLVAASNRTDNTIRFYLLDPQVRRLKPAGAGVPTGLREPYGLCLYAAADGQFYVFVNDAGSGRIRQWRLYADAQEIAARVVREFVVGSQAEGCVADDELGELYVSEEDVGLWKYDADAGGGSRRRQIDRVGGANGLVADLEGVAIWRGQSGSGYVVVSNQGANSYAVYRREGDNAFLGLFSVAGGDNVPIDGTTDTDGLDVTSASLGPDFPEGLLVVQDGRNEPAGQRQNFKLVSWREVAQALELKAKD